MVVIWVMIITTFLTSIVMLVIWKTKVLLVLGFFPPYILIVSMFMTSLLKKIPQRGSVPFAISAIFLTVMPSRTYGRSKKTAYEAERKMSITELDQTLSSSNMHRTPGACFFTDLVHSIPPIIHHYIQHTNSVRDVLVIATIRTLPIKTVLPVKRFNVGRLGHEGVFWCLVRLGYKDSQDVTGDGFVASVVNKLQGITDTRSEKQKIHSAAQKETVFVMERSILKANRKNGPVARFTIAYLYRFL